MSAPPRRIRRWRPRAWGGKETTARWCALRAHRRRVEDGDQAMEQQTLNGFDHEVEGIKRNISASLINEWLGLGLARVDGPTATTSAESEQGSTILQLKGRGGSRGRGSERCSGVGGSGVSFIAKGGRGRSWPVAAIEFLAEVTAYASPATVEGIRGRGDKLAALDAQGSTRRYWSVGASGCAWRRCASARRLADGRRLTPARN